MIPDFSVLFHQASKDHERGHPPIPRDSSKWPSEWVTVEYKAYPRLPKIELPEASLPTKAIGETINERLSARSFDATSVPAKDLSTFLKYSCGIVDSEEGGTRRAHPSGGARFPLEAYVLIFKKEETIPSGVYHYDVPGHALSALRKQPFEREGIGELFRYEWVKEASGAIILTGLFERSQRKYGERGYRYVLLEAGHVAQNMCLLAAALGMKASPVTGINDARIERLLGIDGLSESVLYSVVFGT